MNNLMKLVNFKPEHPHRPYVNSAVRFHQAFTTEERLREGEKVGWNVFDFSSKMTKVDLLSCSGTTTPTIEQLALSLLGDEAYGTNWGYEQLLEQIEKTFGITVLGDKAEWKIFLFHQCRTAEHALFTQIGYGKNNLIIPNNGHFDTTRANIEMNGIEAIDLPSSVNKDFLGNISICSLRELLWEKSKHIPLVYCTITNNTIAGQPVSIENIQEIRNLCTSHKKPLFLDACRFAQNSWFINQREEKYKDASIAEIVHKTFSLCDGFTISFKKDGLANMGGALCIKKGTPLFNEYPNILEKLLDHQICTEGHPSYGGISGRDIMIIVEGLRTVVKKEFLSGRIEQVHRFGEYLKSLNIPVITPFGGHAIYIDIDKFFEGTRMKHEDFGGISLTALLLLSGPRLCELGAFAFGKYDVRTGKETPPPFNYVRAAIPSNKYEEQDLFFVADCIKNLYDRRDDIPKAVPISGREKSLRHMKARFELIPHS